MEKFKYKIDLADGNVWLWESDDTDDLFAYANTVEEFKDILRGEAYNYKARGKEFQQYAKEFTRSKAIR